MSKEETISKVESRVCLSAVYPRISLWTPTSLQKTIEKMVALDSSNVTVYQGGMEGFKVPPISEHLITAVYSDVLISGFSGRRTEYQIQGVDDASFVLFKGSLLVPKYGQPAEMRFALLQTRLSQESLDQFVGKEKEKLDAIRKKKPVSSFFDDS